MFFYEKPFLYNNIQPYFINQDLKKNFFWRYMIWHQDTLIMKQVASKRSSLLLKIILENEQTLQLFTKIIKAEIIYKNY